MARNRIHNYLDRKRQQTCDRLWCEIVCDMLERDLADVLPKWAEQDRLSQFSEDMQMRVQGGGDAG